MPEFGMRFVIHTILVLAGLGYFANTLYGRFRVLQAVRWTNLFDKIPERINALLVYGFGQKKFVIDKQDPGPSWMHFFIFWGFNKDENGLKVFEGAWPQIEVARPSSLARGISMRR